VDGTRGTTAAFARRPKRRAFAGCSKDARRSWNHPSVSTAAKNTLTMRGNSENAQVMRSCRHCDLPSYGMNRQKKDGGQSYESLIAT
jgi:hypothetical protein